MKRIPAIGILFALPFLVVLWIGDQIELERYREAEKTAIDQLIQIVAHFARLGDPMAFFQETSQRVKRALIWNEDPHVFIRSLPPERMKCFIFDWRGKRRKQEGFPEGFMQVSEQCLDCIRKSAVRKGWIMNDKEKRLAESFFGSSSAVELLARNPGKIQSLDFAGIPRLLGIFPYRDRNGRKGFLLVLIENPGSLQSDLVSRALRKIHTLAGPSYGFGTIDLRDRYSDQVTGMNNLSVKVRKAMESEAAGQPIRAEKKIWSTTTLDRQFLLFGACPEPPKPPSFLKRQSYLISSGICLFFLLLAIQAILAKREISIRVQVAVLFSLAGFASILTLLSFAGSYLEMRKGTLLRTRVEQMQQVLEKLDASFPVFRARLAQRYQDLSGELFLRIRGSTSSPDEKGSFARLPGGVSIILFDGQGKMIWRRPSDADLELLTVLGTNYLKTISRAGKISIQLYNFVFMNGRKPDDPYFINEPVVVGKLANIIFDFRNKIAGVYYGFKRLSLFFNFFLGKDGQASAVAWVTFEPSLIERTFLRMAQRRLKWYTFFDSYRFRLIPISPTGFPGRNSSFPLAKSLKELDNMISQSKMPAFRQEQIGNLRLLLTGIPGRTLEEYNLTMVSSLANLQREVLKLSRGFLWFSFLILVFAFSLSYIFSRMLLDPIQELTQGLKHLSQSHFSTRLEISTGDELQVVGEGINAIFEEMTELSLAQNISTQLFPDGPLRSGNWSCRGWNRSHSEIGGEIFDFLELPENHLLLWMAQVPGHSIGSALILAMAKMAVRTLVELKSSVSPEMEGKKPDWPSSWRPDAGSGEFFSELNRMLLEKVRGFESASMMLCLFDKETGKFHLEGKGTFMVGIASGNDPGGSSIFTISGDGDGETNGMPAGKRRLSTGDRLLIFSGGCWDPERATDAGNWGINGILSNLSGIPVDELEGKLFARLDVLNDPRRPSESRSILILEGVYENSHDFPEATK